VNTSALNPGHINMQCKSYSILGIFITRKSNKKTEIKFEEIGGELHYIGYPFQISSSLSDT
jgi:hypothetical protein